MADVLQFSDVTVRRNGNPILSDINWEVTSNQRWVILGPNGAGKTTLLSLAATMLYPSTGTVQILGKLLGRVDITQLRTRIGFAGTQAARRIPNNETVADAVLTAVWGVSGRWREQYEEIDLKRMRRVLSEWELSDLADRTFGTLSDGERKRTQIARAVISDPELLLLDEPAASLDLGAREQFLNLLTGYAVSPTSPAMIIITHHVEEIPKGFTHALLLKDGKILKAGEISETITADNLSALYDRELILTETDGRFWARSK
ncbi:MAG: ABC transporter ATP-binding protein [Microbacteriaceae bacterium]|nr:ABC transporter ATP-binding protein [Microbacteriaceae bacterium]